MQPEVVFALNPDCNFGFVSNQPLTVEGIINAGFDNPDSATNEWIAQKYTNSGTKYCRTASANDLMNRVKTVAPKAEAKFDGEKLTAHD